MDQRRSRSGVTINAYGKFQCGSCPSSFKRMEHLKRHERCHDDLKRFPCSICEKRFTRSDILARHSAIHNQVRLGESLVGGGVYPKRRRACHECARAREKCSKTSPCGRCSARALACIYPDERRQSGDSTDMAQNSSPSQGAGRTPTGYLFTQSDSQQGVSPQLNLTAGPSQPSNYSNIRASGVDSFSPNARPENGNTGTLGDGLVSVPDISVQPYGVTYDYGRLGFQQDRQLRPQSQMYAVQAPVPTTNNFVYGPSVYDGNLDFPMNWLPANDTIEVDYSSILGLSFSPPDFQSGAQAFSYGGPPDTNTDQSENPSPPNAETSNSQPVTSPAATVSPLSQVSVNPLPPSAVKGGLYATSTNGARTPCTVRFRRGGPSVQIQNCISLPSIAEDESLMSQTNSPFALPDLRHLSFEGPSFEHGENRTIKAPVYLDIRTNFRRLCLDPSGLHEAFVSTEFPSMDHLNLFANLYFTYFAPTMPIIHDPLFNISDYWPLALAVAAIGCQYTQTQEFSSCVVPLHEFLRRALLVELEKKEDSAARTPLFQALVLSQVGMLYCGDLRLQTLAKRRHGELATLVKFDGFLQPSSEDVWLSDGTNGITSQWARWVERESRRRLGYSIWLLDCMMVFHFGIESMLSLAMAQVDLPHDGLWATSGETEWLALYQTTSRNPSLFAATQRIFRDKQVKSDLGEFSRIILLHGIFREIFQIKDYFKRSLSSWIPSAQPPQTPDPSTRENQGEITEGKTSRWLTDVSVFSSWRNAALDCVDILHWAANATIAILSGSEHPTVCHLHLARTVLLAPYDEIITLALSVGSANRIQGGRNRVPTRQEAVAAEHEVLQWAQRDESKARLATLHSGTFYWHIRRYSTMSFYEPTAVFLATLTLWAYGYYTSKVTAQRRHGACEVEESRSASASRHVSPDPQDTSPMMQSQDGSAPGDASQSSAWRASQSKDPETSTDKSTYTSGPDPTFVRIDRPCDDEMVQLFVRSGRPPRMKAYITGVGDICAPEGPARVLREGRKILGTVSRAWGRTRQYHDILEALERAIVNRRQGDRVNQ